MVVEDYMKVILLKAVPKVGKPEDVVEVNEGFARNALFPKNLAIQATPATLDALKKKQAARAANKAVRQVLLDKAIEEIAGKSVVYTVPANDQGNLFSKIDAKDIASYLMTTHRLSIAPECIYIPNGAIKKIGNYVITIKDGSYETTLALGVTKQ